MGPDKILALAVAHGDVDGIAIVIHLLPAKGVLDRAVVDLIQIPLAGAAVPGMKVIRHLTAVSHRNVAGQLYIERAYQALAGDGRFGPDTDTEHIGMNSAVGAGASLDVLPASQHRLQCVLKHLRNRQRIFLHLKAVVGGPLVTDGQKKISGLCAHYSNSSKKIPHFLSTSFIIADFARSVIISIRNKR